ncbi:MAG: hypothetical protein GTN71_05420, partial [Anaerolineae bacterium]|nr:hypothetical protein [Anaerolineae bacterium]
FGLPDYYSRIRGGHNFFSIRVSDQPLYSHQEPVHLLLALTEETIPRHRDKIVEGGAIIYDSNVVQRTGENSTDLLSLAVPLSDVAKEKAGTELARNTMGLGVAAGLTGFDLEPMESVIRQNFARKGQKVVDGNLAVVEAGYQEGQKYAADFPFKLERNPDAPPRMVLNGTDAFSLGALAGGCRFVAGYPMTPGSLALHWMAAHAARVRRGHQAHRGRDRGHQHGYRRCPHGGAGAGADLRRRFRVDGGSAGAGGHDGDTGRHLQRPAARAVHRPAHPPRAGGPALYVVRFAGGVPPLPGGSRYPRGVLRDGLAGL